MTVFELQVDPERNAVIRRALAKRIVHQRELEDEEASTEEDESFLGNSITIARKGTSASPSESGSPTKKEHRPHLLHNHNHGHRRHNDHDRSRTLSGDSTHMNVKSRWKSEYLRVKSSSPCASSVSALSEIIPDIAIPVITPTEAPQVVAITAVDGSLSAVTPTTRAIENDSTPTPNPGSPLSTTSRADEPDLAEKDLLSKLEELRKEKSRLFSLFRAALEKSAATSRPSATPPPPPPPPPLPPPLLSAAVTTPVQAPAAPRSASDSTTPSEKINQASISAPATSVSTEMPSRGVKTEPSRPIGRR
ncbi:hypothetical protein BGZ98_001802 [Dissophora globulifera]|nr:hypothetical protein BGZ98_001802 [Dissophora globulifera]